MRCEAKLNPRESDLLLFSVVAVVWRTFVSGTAEGVLQSLDCERFTPNSWVGKTR
jgi:hypothetical protein